MASYRQQAWELAMGQYGYISTRDAAQLGIPPVELAKIAARGRLRQVAYGLYHFDDMPPTRYDQYYEAFRLVGEDAHLTGDAVLALHELAYVNPKRIRVGTRRRVRRALPEWIEIVNDGVDDEHLDEFEGIPTTTVARAFRSCERSVMRGRLLAAIPVALAAGLLSDDEVSQLLEELRG